MNRIIKDLYIGDAVDAIKCSNEFYILSVTDEKPKQLRGTWIPLFSKSSLKKTNREKKYVRIIQLNKAIKLIENVLIRGKVLVHCGAGIERSPLVVAWYLHKKKGVTLDEAYCLIMKKRDVMNRTEWIPLKK